MTASDDVKTSLKGSLEALLGRGRELLGRAEEQFRSVQAQDDAWKAEYVRLHAASCRLPIRPFNRYYQRQLQPATEPLFLGMMDELNDEHFGEMSQNVIEQLTERFSAPAVRAVEAIFDDVTMYFRELSSRILTLRYFSNSDALLKKFENSLSPPWAKPINVVGSMTQFRLPIGLGLQPVTEHPPHLQIHAIRDANQNTLAILRGKLREIVATLQTAIDELPFAEKLQTPKPVPQTLIDYSTHIGEGANVRDAAIGQGAQRQR